MAATDRHITRGMILPDLSFVRREAGAALRAFYAPFSGLRDAWRIFRSSQPNVDGSASRVFAETPAEPIQLPSLRGDGDVLSVRMATIQPRHTGLSSAANLDAPSSPSSKSGAPKLAEDIERHPANASAFAGAAAGAAVGAIISGPLGWAIGAVLGAPVLRWMSGVDKKPLEVPDDEAEGHPT